MHYAYQKNLNPSEECSKIYDLTIKSEKILGEFTHRCTKVMLHTS